VSFLSFSLLLLFPNHKQDGIILLPGPRNTGHNGAGLDGEILESGIGRRRGRTTERLIPRRPAGQMSHIQQGSFIELPAPLRVNGQPRRHLSTSRHPIPAGRYGKLGRFHNQAVFFDPPIVGIELPSQRCDVLSIDQLRLIIAQPHAARTGIVSPQTPGLRIGAVGGRGIAPGGQELGLRQSRKSRGRVHLELVQIPRCHGRDGEQPSGEEVDE